MPRRSLAFVLAGMMNSCSTPALALPSSAPRPPQVEQMRCDPDLRKILIEGERPLKAVCREKYSFVLTNTSLITIPRSRRTIDTDRGRLEVDEHSREGMEDYHAIGIADFTASNETKFILTKDGVLTRIPVGENEGAKTCRMPFDVKGGKVEYHNGALVIAGKDVIYASYFKKGCSGDVLPYKLKTKERRFFGSEGRLFFGNESDRIEIVVDGQKVKLR